MVLYEILERRETRGEKEESRAKRASTNVAFINRNISSAYFARDEQKNKEAKLIKFLSLVFEIVS